MQNAMTPSSRSRLPRQAPPVDRTFTSSAVSGGPGVEAALFGIDLPSVSDVWETFKKYAPTAIDIAKTYGPAIAAAL
jgi:hypothetical protein